MAKTHCSKNGKPNGRVMISKVAVITGSRNWNRSELIWGDLVIFNPQLILVGDCPTGADKFALEWASNGRCPILVFNADWKTDGKKAGPLRNSRLVNCAKSLPDHCIVKYFAYPVGDSPGTRDCIRKLQKADIHGKTTEG